MKFIAQTILVCLLCSAPFALAADDKWLLTTADFKSETVALQGLDSSGAKVSPIGGAAQVIPLEQFLDLTRTIATVQGSGKFELHLTGGDRLNGEPVTLNADALVWKNDLLGEISIPSSRMVAITKQGKPAPAERGHQDVVQLGNGDAVEGIIASMSADKITVQTSAGNSDVPMSSVASILFASTPGGGDSRRGFRVRIDDGSSLVGSDAKVDGDSVVLTLARGVDRKIPLLHVSAIEQVNGPVSWLSSRTPSDAIYYPFVGTSQGPANYMDRSWLGQHGIEFKGRPFAHGIGVHAYSSVTWPLDGKFETFRTRYAIDGDSGVADATVRIKLDEKVAYERSHVRAGTLSPVVLVDLNGAKKMTLEVDGGPAYAEDSLSWIEPALLSHKPTGPPATDPATDDSAPATQASP
jgi:hypothetical protein